MWEPIWLTLNVVWEFTIAHSTFFLFLAALLLLLYGSAIFLGKVSWAKGFRHGVYAAVLVWIAAVFTVPALVDSSLADMGYWVDWANLFAIGAVFAALALLLVWPASAIAQRSKSS